VINCDWACELGRRVVIGRPVVVLDPLKTGSIRMTDEWETSFGENGVIMGHCYEGRGAR
jgi:hypothetical protein